MEFAVTTAVAIAAGLGWGLFAGRTCDKRRGTQAYSLTWYYPAIMVFAVTIARCVLRLTHGDTRVNDTIDTGLYVGALLLLSSYMTANLGHGSRKRCQ